MNCQNITTLFFYKKPIAFFPIIPYTINRGEAMPTKIYEVFNMRATVADFRNDCEGTMEIGFSTGEVFSVKYEPDSHHPPSWT